MSVLNRIIHKKNKNKIEAHEILKHYAANIAEYNPRINAFVHSINLDHITSESLPLQTGDKELNFAGIPVGYKDNICTKNLPTSCASKVLQNYYSPFDATVVSRLQDQGFITIGKTNMDEFAMGSATNTGIYGATKNPWSLQCEVGGSSGGSAAAVAARMVPVALGSDTGGSVRDPAHFCGVIGMKPSYGAVSRYGLVSYASSLDQIGVMANFAVDAAYVLDIIGGKDDKDHTSFNIPKNFFSRTIEKSLLGITIGIDQSLFLELDLSAQSLINHTLNKLKHAGAWIRNIKMPDLSDAVGAYYVLASAEASSNLARYDGIRFGGIQLDPEQHGLESFYRETRTIGFGMEVKKRIALGNFVLLKENYESYFQKSQKYRRFLFNYLNEIYKNVDCILLPTLSYAADQIYAQSDYDIYRAGRFVILANLSGDPSITFPIGKNNNFPFSAQLMTKRFNDPLLLNIVNMFEKYNDIHLEKPPISGQSL